MMFATESWSVVKPEFDALGEDSFYECGTGGGKAEYAPDYMTLDALGDLLHMTTARVDGKLVGYVMSVIMPRHLQFSACSSQSISVYLQPEYRTGFNGVNMMKHDEKSLKDSGVQVMYGGFTLDKDLSSLFQRQGWQEVERVYMKWIS